MFGTVESSINEKSYLFYRALMPMKSNTKSRLNDVPVPRH